MGDVLLTVHSARLGRLSVGCRNKRDACHASELEKLKQSSSTHLRHQCKAGGLSEVMLQKPQWN